MVILRNFFISQNNERKHVKPSLSFGQSKKLFLHRLIQDGRKAKITPCWKWKARASTALVKTRYEWRIWQAPLISWAGWSRGWSEEGRISDFHPRLVISWRQNRNEGAAARRRGCNPVQPSPPIASQVFNRKLIWGHWWHLLWIEIDPFFLLNYY